MKLAPARQAAFGALIAVDRGAWSAEALAAKSAHLDARDAALASDIVFGTLRHRGELDWLIAAYSSRPVDRLDPAVRIALEMALYQMRFQERIPGHAAVNDSVELARRAGKSSAAALVNAVLRRSIREPMLAPENASTPAWLLDRWTAQYGADVATGISKASLQVPERYIRVGIATPPPGAEATDVPGCYRLTEVGRSPRTAADALVGLFESSESPAGVPARTGASAPLGFRFQDIGSQAVVPLLDLHRGQTFLDLCAAPGNKTAQALESGVKAIACDLHMSRARTLLTLGIPVIALDAAKPLPFTTRFDRILVDAPCSGTGTLARNPEIKWRLRSDDIADLQSRQTAILRSALTQLSPGGLLVYSTCSLEREENEDVVAASGATVLKTMQRIPGRDAGDGFFAAVLRFRV